MIIIERPFTGNPDDFTMSHCGMWITFIYSKRWKFIWVKVLRTIHSLFSYNKTISILLILRIETSLALWGQFNLSWRKFNLNLHCGMGIRLHNQFSHCSIVLLLSLQKIAQFFLELKNIYKQKKYFLKHWQIKLEIDWISDSAEL